MYIHWTKESGTFESKPLNGFGLPVIILVFTWYTEINKYDSVIHYPEVSRLDILVQKAATMHFLDDIYHLDKYLKETQLFD